MTVIESVVLHLLYSTIEPNVEFYKNRHNRNNHNIMFSLVYETFR